MSTRARPPVAWSHRRDLTRRGVLWLGLRCDIRCKFCYDNHVPASEKGWLGADDAIKALEKFRFYYHNEFVDLMGGEPTLHPAILGIVAHAAKIGLRPTVITHGMHLAKPERARAFAEAGIHDFLVSIHGIGDTVRAIHGRGKNNHARQARALAILGREDFDSCAEFSWRVCGVRVVRSRAWVQAARRMQAAAARLSICRSIVSRARRTSTGAAMCWPAMSG